MSWKIGDIFAQRKEKAAARFKDASHEDLVERIAELEATLWLFAATLSCLDDKAWRGTTATSKLFPETFSSDDSKEESQFWVFDHDKRNFVPRAIDAKDLHAVDYELCDSIEIADGSQLSDDFEIIATHQQEPATYVFGGAVWMGDVRRAVDVLFRGNSLTKDIP